MKKKFISKKRRRLKLRYRRGIFYVILLIILVLVLSFVSKLRFNKVSVINILRYSNNLEVHDIKKNVVSLANFIIKIDVNNPQTILQSSIVYKEHHYVKPNMKLVHVDSPVTSDEPLIYIYNTHPTEAYADFENNIKTASYYMRDKLEGLGVKTLLSTDDIPQMLRDNNWTYDDSYLASRIELLRVKEEYPSIKLFIDLHRDGLKKEYSTAVIDNVSYAKVLFLVGKEHSNYLYNLDFTNSINDMIVAAYPNITRGVHQMEGPGVHGIYNQDVGSNVILLEMGGNENTYEEVIRTIDLIVPMIKEKVYEK
ncbi:MAG: stage II sporulation protein P [Bacilli bacterium]|nr:stage II sporulation protein P [Bacilli bacterium]